MKEALHLTRQPATVFIAGAPWMLHCNVAPKLGLSQSKVLPVGGHACIGIKKSDDEAI